MTKHSSSYNQQNTIDRVIESETSSWLSYDKIDQEFNKIEGIENKIRALKVIQDFFKLECKLKELILDESGKHNTIDINQPKCLNLENKDFNELKK